MFGFFKRNTRFEIGDRIIFVKDAVVEDKNGKKITITKGTPGLISGKNVIQSKTNNRKSENVEITYNRYYKVVLQNYKDKIKKVY